MNYRLSLLLFVLFCCAAFTAPVLLHNLETVITPSPTTSPPPRLGSAPTFSLVDSRGEAFHSHSLRGRPWVANFFFTSCGGPCPPMNAAVSRLVAEFPDVRFVSISIDSERDTPATLADYAKRFSADPARWTFLTGDLATIAHLSHDGFHQALDSTAMVHSTRLILIDGSSEIRGYFDSASAEGLERLRAAIRTVVPPPSNSHSDLP